jgi:phage terminase large subunit-like protein
MVPDDGDDFWPSLGPQVCDWIEDNLVFGPGDLRGTPAKIDEEKRALIYRAYEVFPEDHEQAGRRRFKKVGFSLAKGMAKTEMAAWIAAAELHQHAPVRCIRWENGEPIGGPVTDPYIALVAYTEEQSDELAYGALKAILEESRIRDDFDIGLERIMRVTGDGKAVSLSGSPNARDGARTTFQVFDETHRHTLQKLRAAYQTMQNNLPKRKMADAWSLEVTTAYEPGGGSIAEDTMNYALAIHEGRSKKPEDARLFFFHRQASEDHDLATEEGARAAVIEASGPAGAWRDIEAIVEQWHNPTTDRQYWERVWCNRPVQSSKKAFDLDAFKKLAAPKAVDEGSLITIGFDGAQFRDATAVVATHVSTGYQWLAGAWECPYGVTDWQVPAEEVDACVADLFERFNVWRMYADPPYWQSWISQWQGKYGDKRVIEWWTNRRTQMAAALESFETAIREESLSHDGSELVARHIGNSHRHDLLQHDEENRQRWMIKKERPDSPRKIDAAMAAVLSWEARTDAVASGVAGDPVFPGGWDHALVNG